MPEAPEEKSPGTLIAFSAGMSKRLPLCASARITLLLSLLAGSAGATNGTPTVNPDGTVTVTYTNDTPTPIPDGDLAGVLSTIEVPDSLLLTSASVTVNIAHPSSGNLRLDAVSARGSTAVLPNGRGWRYPDVHQTVSVPAYVGQNSQGTWSLHVTDIASWYTGFIQDWSITLTGVPAAPPSADSTPPSVELVGPGNGADVRGHVALTATAADDVAVSEVRFFVDGQRVGIATQAPYTVSWQGSVGPVTVVAEVADTHNHVTRSAPMQLWVVSSDDVLVISEVTVVKDSANTAVITWRTNVPSSSEVIFGPTPQSYSFSTETDPGLVTEHRVKLKGLTRDASYHLRVRSQDEGWHFAYSPDVPFSTAK